MTVSRPVPWPVPWPVSRDQVLAYTFFTTWGSIQKLCLKMALVCSVWHRRRVVAHLCVLLIFCAFASSRLFGQLSTTDHLAEPGFWPTRSGGPRSEYAGSDACASCHAAKVASQRNTPMAQNAMRASESEILNSHPEMNFSFGPFRYEIKTNAKNSVYTVTEGAHSETANLLWAFGVGRAGQSYLFKKSDGHFYEARVTYFSTLQTIHFTPARAMTSAKDPKDINAKDVEEAMYRPVGEAEVERCFGCHTTASVPKEGFNEKTLLLGVTCEACHGTGAKHVASAQAAMVAGMTDAAPKDIFNPASLHPVDSVDFCGACHATWWDVRLSGLKGPATARSQPYRLESSKCWGSGDARLTCMACHDPHKPLQTEPSDYDAVCASCHVTAGEKKTASHPGEACPTSIKNCVSCHMEKVYVPEMHSKFTDHRIRVVHAGEAYPE